MDKKKYIEPSFEVIEINVEAMIAASNGIIGLSDDAADDSEVYSRGRRGKWGNLWYND